MTYEAVKMNCAGALAGTELGTAARGRSRPLPVADRRHRQQDLLAYRLIFAAAFLVFLVTLSLERVMPWRWLRVGAASSKSVVAQAREAASIGAGYAFMG